MNKDFEELKQIVNGYDGLELERIDVEVLVGVISYVNELQQENKQLKEQLKQSNEVNDEVINYLGFDEDTLKECSIYDVNGIELYKILTKYKGGNNENR